MHGGCESTSSNSPNWPDYYSCLVDMHACVLLSTYSLMVAVVRIYFSHSTLNSPVYDIKIMCVNSPVYGIMCVHVLVNPRRACAARVTVLCLFVGVSLTVSDTTLQASVVKRTLKFRHQRHVNDTLQCFDSWILLRMLGSRDMAKFVSQEAYDRAI